MTLQDLLQMVNRGTVFSDNLSIQSGIVYQYYSSDIIFIFKIKTDSHTLPVGKFSKRSATIFPTAKFIKKEFSIAQLCASDWQLFGKAAMLETDLILKLLPDIFFL